jgi:hypothetical protein
MDERSKYNNTPTYLKLEIKTNLAQIVVLYGSARTQRSKRNAEPV